MPSQLNYRLNTSSYLRCFCFACLTLLLSTTSFAQDASEQKLEWYAYWGWNRAWYTKSNIHLHGNQYDLTLEKVTANDRPTAFSAKLYFAPTTLSIPQTNFRLGVKINQKWSISGGVDHMKYVVNQHQKVKVNGDELPNQFPEKDTDNQVEITPEWFQFEHTDGLNYVNFEMRRHVQFLGFKKVSVNGFAGAGLGFLLPKTNATVFGKERNDAFHVAGFGIDGVSGINITFFDLIFVQTEGKLGYINMPDIRTSPNKADRASQQFGFAQWNVVLGVKF